MSEILKTFRDGSILEYDYGKFDKWCIYLTRPNASKYPPKDIAYFRSLKNFAFTHGTEQVYMDFVKIYDLTKNEIDQSVFKTITELSQKYGQDSVPFDIDFSVLYAGMVSEEKKENTKLGKRIKRLGVYQLLHEELTPEEAASYSRGKNWRDIATDCRKRGF